jgi:hypothetical protein
MATATVVFTYTPGVDDGSGEKAAKVTSFTVSGTAYNSLTEAEMAKALTLFRQALAGVIRDAKVPAKGYGNRKLTS